MKKVAVLFFISFFITSCWSDKEETNTQIQNIPSVSQQEQTLNALESWEQWGGWNDVKNFGSRN